MSAFEAVTPMMVAAEVRPGERLYSQRGAMLGYTGDVTFTPDLTNGQGGVRGMIGRRVAGEAAALMTVEGSGRVFFGSGGHHVHVIELTGDLVHVESDRLLAFSGSLRQGTVFLGKDGGVAGMVRGKATGQGLFTTTLEGGGGAAVLAHGGVFELPVGPDAPVHVDPQAYVAHRGQLRNRLTTALGWREMVGRGSGEGFQLELTGQGTVFVQASERKL